MSALGLRSGSFVAGRQAGAQGDLLTGTSHYGAIYADPPWRFETYSDKGQDRAPAYGTLTVEEICALPVGALAAPDSALFLWAVLNMIPEAIAVGEAWGFHLKTARVWAKTRVGGFCPKLSLDQNFPMGTGYIVRGNPELLLIFTRGEPRFRSRSTRALIIAARREHSRKPPRVRADIEQMVAGPYLELFARETARGWDAWGDQVGAFSGARP